MEVVLLSDVYSEGWIRGAGAYRLATELRKQGYPTQVIDFCSRLTEQEARKVFDKFITNETTFVGVSNTFMHNEGHKIFAQDWMFDLLQEYKEKYNIVFVIGGNRGGLGHYHKAAKKLFDILVTGFADKAIIDIANACRKKDLSILHSKKFNDNQIIVDCKHEYLYNDFQNSQIIWEKQDCIFEGEALPIETARGCIFRCSFCFFPGNGKRGTNDYMKNKEILKEEMLRNYELFGTNVYDIMDDLLNDSPEKCEFVHDVFTSLPFKVKYASYARADLLISQPQTLPLLEESGCIGMQFGIETLNKKAGAAIGKGMGREKTIEGIHWVKENSNVSLGSGFIMGLPFESLESMRETIEWLDSPNCPLDNKEVYALSIPSLKSHFEHSKLMVDPYKFGYKDLDPKSENKMIWDNGHINWYQAEELKKECLQRFKLHNHFNAHQIPRVYNTGAEIDMIVNTPAYVFRQKNESIKPESKKISSIKEKYLEKLYAV